MQLEQIETIEYIIERIIGNAIYIGGALGHDPEYKIRQSEKEIANLKKELFKVISSRDNLCSQIK